MVDVRVGNVTQIELDAAEMRALLNVIEDYLTGPDSDDPIIDELYERLRRAE